MDDVSLEGRLEKFADSLVLLNVRFLKCTAELLKAVPDPVDDIDIERTEAQFYRDGTLFANKLDFDVSFRNEAHDQIAKIEVVVLLEFSIPEEQAADDDVVSAFIDEAALFMAYPYVREAIQTLGARIGLDSTILGIIRPTSGAEYRAVTVVNRRS